MEWQKKRAFLLDTGKNILLCFSVVVLACAVKNYLAFLLQGTVYCEYICPSVFRRESFALPEFLNTLFAFQNRIVEITQDYLDLFWSDPHKLLSTLIAAPLVEETIYRGPLLFFRKRSDNRLLYWVSAIVLSVPFALSHDLNGLLLLPIFVFGLCSSWLIAKTRKFWPSLAFHVLYNAYFLSITLYQTLFWSD